MTIAKNETPEQRERRLKIKRKNSTKWRANNRERERASRRAWLTANPEKVRKHNAKSYAKKHHAGATRPRPEKCEVCDGNNAMRALYFDHCHRTGLFRGWLCSNCNLALGHVKDNPERLRALAVYLEAFEATQARPTSDHHPEASAGGH